MPARTDVTALRGLPNEADLAFLRKLDAKSKHAVCRPSGGSDQAENATRQRCRRRGWVLFRDLGQGFGWILTAIRHSRLERVRYRHGPTPL